MPLALYMDHHVSKTITLGLRLRGVDVLTAYEDGAEELADDRLLSRATELGRVLFSQDEDLLIEALHRQQMGIQFRGIIYAHQARVAIGRCIQDLEVLAQAGEPEDLMNQVQYLPF